MINPARTFCIDGPILRIGEAIAIAIAMPATGGVRAERDAAASTELRRVTGRRDIAILRRPSGRPCLAAPYPEPGISLARRGSLLIAGFSPRHHVGVDLEAVAPSTDFARMAVDHYSPGEASAILARPPSGRGELFTRLWVAKEAVLKLTGRGVYDGMRSPDFEPVLDLLECDGEPLRLPQAGLIDTTLVVRSHPGPDGSVHFCALGVRN